MFDIRHRQVLQALWSAGPASRWELHERTGQTPNRAGTVVESLLRQKLVRELEPEPLKAGRPRVPLEIDPASRHVIGLAIEPGKIEACRLGLSGQLLERLPTPTKIDPATLIRSAANVLSGAIDKRTLGVGVTVTGFVDPQDRSLLLSSAMPGQKPVSLRPLDKAADGLPLVLGNDMHALAARWSLQHQAEPQQDVLLVWFDDGRIGSAVLIDGRPNRGCLAGGNELGHARFPLETDRCFCGQTGCLERVFSTAYLSRLDNSRRRTDLAKRTQPFDPADASLQTILTHLCGGLANAVNFLRPHRLVLASPLATNPPFRDALTQGTRDLLLSPLQRAVSIDFWDLPPAAAAENAAWLINAELLWTGWDATVPRAAG